MEKKRSIRDAVNEHKNKQQDEPKPQQPIARPPECLGKPPNNPSGSRRPPAPPIVKYETIKALCGHEVQFGLFADGKDRFRAERRKKHQNKNCPDCTKKQQQQAMADAVERRKAKKKAKQDAYAQLSSQMKDRLPDKAEYHAYYDATTMRWDGVLVINHVPESLRGTKPEEKSIEFRGASGAVFKLLGKLDLQWRKFLEERKPKEGTQ